MGKILVLAEKPSVGRELARYLGASQGRDGFLEGERSRKSSLILNCGLINGLVLRLFFD